MPTIGETTPNERRNAMRAAVGYNLPCDVRADLGGYPVHLKSRFFTMEAGPQGPQVVIEAPMQNNVVVPLRPGEPVSVFFRVDQVRYTYPTTILDRREFTLSGGDRTRALATAYPHRMLRGQRREYFRIAIPPDAPIPVNIGLVARGATDPTRASNIAFRSQTEIVNMSASGLAFDLWEEFSRSLRSGDRILCDIPLPNGSTVSLHGRVVNTYFMRGQRIVRYGVEFVDLETSVDLKMAQNRLLRYVVDVQRERLAERSGLYD